MAILSYRSDQARAVWRSCLSSAFRSALACTIVGVVTLFGPQAIKRQVAFPAFSYVTVILIVTDATLGDTLRGCWHALNASILGVCPAILSLWLIGPGRLTTSTTAAAVAITAFVVVLPENSHLISKRIALGQIVIVYVLAFINGAKTEPVMHPLHVAASTAVGVLACVLALLLPYPNLAFYEVKQNSKLLAENSSERLHLFVKAFSAEDNTSAQALISQAKSMAKTGTKLFQSIKSKQESMQWEMFPVKFIKSYCAKPGERLQYLETPLKGMEIALTSCATFPLGMLQNGEFKNELNRLEEHISEQLKSTHDPALATAPESNEGCIVKSLQTLQTIPTTQKALPPMFFLFCLRLLENKPKTTSATRNCAKDGPNDTHKQKGRWFSKSIWRSSKTMNINSKRLMPAFRASLALGLAVLFGSIYSKENGYWSGLPVAISLAAAREATFKVANVKAQGTVLGTVYGVLGCFVFQKYVNVRFLSLLPWFVFSSFLRRSRMYGQAGGISAVIGAVLILGRKNFGPPSEFAIARITETFIGLSCSIMVDLLLQPTRAATLAKIHLCKSLQALHDCVASMNFHAMKSELEENQRILKAEVNEFGKYIFEAEVEPNFWFLPFHSACYSKLLGSLSKMTELLEFATRALQFMGQESGRIDGNVWKENLSKLDGDLKLFKDMTGSSIKCFEEVNLIKSLALLDKELEKKKASFDIELGKPSPCSVKISGLGNDEVVEKNMNSFLQHSKEIVDNIVLVDGGDHDDLTDQVKSQLVLSLSALGFCISGLVKETREIEKLTKELVQWDNPGSQVNLHEISCKVRALANI